MGAGVCGYKKNIQILSLIAITVAFRVLVVKNLMESKVRSKYIRIRSCLM